MQLQTGRDLGRLWFIAGGVFFTCVAIVKSLGRREEAMRVSLWVGYVGLAAVGAVLLASWVWVERSGPASPVILAGLYALIAVGIVLWLLALVFPFL